MSAKVILEAAVAQLAVLRSSFIALEATIEAAKTEMDRVQMDRAEVLVGARDMEIPITTWRRACRCGEIAGARKIGRRYLAPAASVKAWIASRAAPKAPASPVSEPANEVDDILNRALSRGRGA